MGAGGKVKHGHSKRGNTSPTYNSYASMIARCRNRNLPEYKYYGGRGIEVCERWLGGFQYFLEDMGERPSIKHTLDRFPDKDGNYEPNNCRWATKLEQARNTNLNHRISYNGETHCISEWAEILGMRPDSIRQRVRNSFSWEEAISIPKFGRRV